MIIENINRDVISSYLKKEYPQENIFEFNTKIIPCVVIIYYKFEKDEFWRDIVIPFSIYEALLSEYKQTQREEKLKRILE